MLRRTTELTKHIRNGKIKLVLSTRDKTLLKFDQLNFRRLSTVLQPNQPRYNSEIFNSIFCSRCMSNESKKDSSPHESSTQSDDRTNNETKKLEIDTNKGKIFVTAKIDNRNNKIDSITIEKPVVKNESTISTNMPSEKTDEEVKKALETELDIKLNPKVHSAVESSRDHELSPLDRKFITPVRAMSDFLLKPADLEPLKKTKRRSPYESEPPITVLWRRDVEATSLRVWGSRENLLNECLKREYEKKKHQQNIFTVKRRLRDYRREIGSKTKTMDEETGLFGKSGKVVLTAVTINALNFVFKFAAWVYTGSHSMFAESIHSLADTLNQCILAYGIHKSTQIADSDHPYGYANMKYVTSLISGVGIFCIGTGLSYYHGIIGLLEPEPVGDLFWGLIILGGSLASEGATLAVAVNRIRDGAKKMQISFSEYVLRGQDPCVNVVLTEDMAAVLSVAMAASCMGIASITHSPIPDAIGSLLVGSMLGAVASFIIYQNVAALVGRSIPQENLDRINAELENDIMIRAIHDVKGIDMGNSLVRYKAEMDFDGRELTRVYLDKVDLSALLQEVKTFQSIDELETFLLKHGENIVDLMGGEIDRIEMKLRKKFPEIRHCDLEIL